MSALHTPKPVSPDPFMSSSEFELNNLIRGKTRTAWEYYRRWLARYREDNPTDERGDFELIAIFEQWAMRRAGKLPSQQAHAEGDELGPSPLRAMYGAWNAKNEACKAIGHQMRIMCEVGREAC